jgi:hypothetical protein
MQASSGSVAQKVFDRWAAMDWGAVPQDQQLAMDLAQEVVQPRAPAVDMERFPILAHFMDESDVLLASGEWFDEGLELTLDGMRAFLTREMQRREHVEGY